MTLSRKNEALDPLEFNFFVKLKRDRDFLVYWRDVLQLEDEDEAQSKFFSLVDRLRSATKAPVGREVFKWDKRRLTEFFWQEKKLFQDSATFVAGQAFTRFVTPYNITVLNLDGIFAANWDPFIPKELFLCSNVRIMTLRNNHLRQLSPDIGRLSELEYLSLTNNKLRGDSIPRTLAFCRNLKTLHLDSNFFEAVPCTVLRLPALEELFRLDNQNHFKTVFLWYRHIDSGGRRGRRSGNKRVRVTSTHPPEYELPQEEKAWGMREGGEWGGTKSLKYWAGKAVIGSNINFFSDVVLPEDVIECLVEAYPLFNICDMCQKAVPIRDGGYSVYTFRNPFLGLTCVPFEHWTCSLDCAMNIDEPAQVRQKEDQENQDQSYNSVLRRYGAIPEEEDSDSDIVVEIGPDGVPVRRIQPRWGGLGTLRDWYSRRRRRRERRRREQIRAEFGSFRRDDPNSPFYLPPVPDLITDAYLDNILREERRLRRRGRCTIS